MIKRIYRKFSRERDLTNGSIAAHIWFLSLPIIVTNFLQTLFNLVDMFWVGKLGPDAIAAVAMSGTVLMIVMFFMIGVGTGTTALVARFIGAKKQPDADNTAMQSITMGFFISVFFSIIGYFISPWLLTVLGASPEVISAGTGYLQIEFVGIFIVFFLFLISAILQGAGDVVTPMIVLAVGTVLNIVLDPFFIFGIGFFPKWGVNGAAFATVLSRAIGSLIALEVLLHGRSRVHVRLSEYKFDFGVMWRILKIGIPSSAQMSLRGLMNLFVTAFVAAFGTFAVAAFGIGARLEMIVVMPGFGFAGAAATLVGQNLGAKSHKRAEISAWYSTFYYVIFMAVMAVVFYVFAPQLTGFFTSTPEVVRIGSQYLRFMAVTFIFTGISLPLNRALVGAGDTVAALVITLISLWAVLVPLAYYLAFPAGLGLTGIWAAVVAASTVMAVINVIYFRWGSWKLKKV